MKATGRFVAALATLMLALDGCGGGGQSPPPVTAPAGPAVLGSRALSSLGAILVDGQGQTLYVNVRQKDNPSACNRDCLSVWPPVLASSSIHLEGGLSAALAGSVTLSGGSREITYNHYLLHSYVGDSLPGQANGQAVQGAWYVLSALGTPVRSGA